MWRRSFRFGSILAIGVLIVSGFVGYSRIDAPGVIPASACREGAVLSTDQFTTTGFSQSRTVGPSDEAPAGAWVIADNYVPTTGVSGSPNCPLGGEVPPRPLNVVALKLTPTIGSWQSADIQELKLIRDMNCNGQFEDGLDITMQTRPGSELGSSGGTTFFFGPQSTIFSITSAAKPTTCGNGTVGLMAVVEIGPNPTSGSSFGLSLEALAADVPGMSIISSGFSSSNNPAGSSIRLQIVGGSGGGGGGGGGGGTTPPPGGGGSGSGSATGHISNGSGNVETDVQMLNFGGSLKSRFREDPVRPGSREALAMAIAICDGGTLGNNNANILVPVAGAAPQIAGGLASIPCIQSPASDGLATGFNGGVLTFSGPLVQYLGTVRVYADTRMPRGTLFNPNEMVAQGVPQYNSGTGQALLTFGRQGQIMSDNTGQPVADQADRQPLVMVFTVDIDNNAPSGTVNVALGLGVGDDTAQGGGGICATNLGVNCGSNIMGSGPIRNSFQVVAQGGGTTPPPGGGGSHAAELRSYDTNSNDMLETSEFLAVIDAWIARRISDGAFFASIDLWIDQRPISSASVGSDLGVRTQMTSRGVRFSAPRASSLSVDVFGLDGRAVFSEAAAGTTLGWNLRSSQGAPVANGVYLYRTTMTTPEGQIVRSDVRKLVVSR